MSLIGQRVTDVNGASDNRSRRESSNGDPGTTERHISDNDRWTGISDCRATQDRYLLGCAQGNSGLRRRKRSGGDEYEND